jgi:hypothetical protein
MEDGFLVGCIGPLHGKEESMGLFWILVLNSFAQHIFVEDEGWSRLLLYLLRQIRFVLGDDTF